MENELGMTDETNVMDETDAIDMTGETDAADKADVTGEADMPDRTDIPDRADMPDKADVTDETEVSSEERLEMGTEDAKESAALCAREQEAIVEAVLFTMGESVEISRLAAALGESEQTAREAAERLRERYQSEKRGIQIVALENRYQMCTVGKYYENLIRVAAAPKKQVLSDVVLETLAIIAYRQPVTKIEIEKIRGVKSDHAVNRLIEYNLVYEAGRMDAPGRPALFATTEEFLRRFGVGSVTSLPEIYPEQVIEMREEVEEELKEEWEAQAEEEKKET